MTTPGENHSQQTFVLLKPDAIRRGLVGEIVGRMERSGLELVAARLLVPTAELAASHYGEEIAERYGEQVRGALLEYICAGPSLATVWRGPEAVATARQIAGDRAQPADCSPGSIRRDLGFDTIALSNAEKRALENLVHTSDAPEAADREINLWRTAMRGPDADA